MLAILKKKIFLKFPRTKKLAWPWKFLVEASVAIKFIFGFCRFPDISGRFWNTKSEQVEAENYDSTGGKEKQMNISRETDFRADQKKSLFRYI